MAKAGSIEYDIEVDTKGTLRAEKAVDKSVNAIVNDFKRVDVAAKKTGTQMTKTSKAVKNGMAGVSKGAGQAGIQVQQFIGQVQGGQSAILAFSQQSADLGFVLGFPLAGAVSGIAASLVGILLPALFKTSEATKDFSFDVKEVVKDLEKLEELSKAQVSVAITKTNKSMKGLSKEAGEAGKKIAVLNQQLDAGVKVNVRIEKSGRAIVESIKLTKKETEKLTKELAQEQANLDAISQEYKKESDLLVELTKNKDGFTKGTKDQKEAIKSLEQSLKAQLIALRDGEEAAFRFATAQELGLKVGEQIPANLDKQIAAFFRLKKEMKDIEDSRKILSKSSRVGDIGLTSLQSLEKRFEIEQGLLDDAVDSKLMTEANFLERSKVLREKFISDVESIEKGSAAKFALIGLTEDEVLIERFNRQNEILKQAREKDLLTEIEFISRKENLQNQHEDNLEKLREKSTTDAIINFQALENQVIGTFASIASGAQDGKDAIKSLAQSILTQMIGALIKMGIQAIIGQTAATTAAVASAGVIATAAAPAAALMSLATAGANAVPASAGIASTVALAQGLAIPGLEHGGNARAGGLFQVGEGGKPEIFTSGGKNFMIPGDSGVVTSNKDAFGGQQVQMNVTIENNVSSAGIQTQMSDDGKNLKIMVNEVANQINTGQGAISRALRNSTNTTFKANR